MADWLGFTGNYPNKTVGSLRCSGECEGFVAQNIDIGLYAVSPGTTGERFFAQANKDTCTL